MTHINLRRDTAANWASTNPVLQLGETGIERDTRKTKQGDGATPWNGLQYATQPFDNAALTGNPTAPTQSPGNNTTRIATTAFVAAAGALKADLASPTLTGDPQAPTRSPGDNDTSIATTAYADAIGALKANIASPTFTGDPKAPTPANTDNDTSIATTAFAMPRTALGITGTDIDTLTTTGFFSGASLTGTLPASINEGRIVVTGAGAYVCQIFVNLGGTRMFYRTSQASVWGAWTEVGRAELPGSATLDFPSIAAQTATATSSQTLTITVTGANAGDTVAVGPPSGINAGLTWCAWVSAANTVSIRLFNNTAAAIDPASATWTARVIR